MKFHVYMSDIGLKYINIRDGRNTLNNKKGSIYILAAFIRTGNFLL